MWAFFPESPPRCAAPTWLPYEMFQGKWAARRLAAQAFRTYRSFPEAPEFRGSLRGGGFAPRYAARAQALFQMLAFASLAPTTSLGNKVAVTNVLTSFLPARQKQMIEGSTPCAP